MVQYFSRIFAGNNKSVSWSLMVAFKTKLFVPRIVLAILLLLVIPVIYVIFCLQVLRVRFAAVMLMLAAERKIHFWLRCRSVCSLSQIFSVVAQKEIFVFTIDIDMSSGCDYEVEKLFDKKAPGSISRLVHSVCLWGRETFQFPSEEGVFSSWLICLKFLEICLNHLFRSERWMKLKGN